MNNCDILKTKLERHAVKETKFFIEGNEVTRKKFYAAIAKAEKSTREIRYTVRFGVDDKIDEYLTVDLELIDTAGD